MGDLANLISVTHFGPTEVSRLLPKVAWHITHCRYRKQVWFTQAYTYHLILHTNGYSCLCDLASLKNIVLQAFFLWCYTSGSPFRPHVVTWHWSVWCMCEPSKKVVEGYRWACVSHFHHTCYTDTLAFFTHCLSSMWLWFDWELEQLGG